MKITRLSVANLRAFEQASFDFDPGFTLLVGVNGVGKTTVLEALRIGLSRLLPQFTASKSRPEAFTTEDIRVGDPSLTVDLDFIMEGTERHWLLHKQRVQNVPHKDGIVREQTLETPDREAISPAFGKEARALKSAKTQPIALYFATRRSMVSDEQVKIGKASGGQATSFAYALAPRPLRLVYLAEWMLAQERLSPELPRAAEHLKAFRAAAQRFLPDCQSLRAEKDNSERPRLLVTKGGISLDVRQLSDGERSMLALVLDLAQRLSQANPGLDDPVRDGAAVVLIDELDMHMHPLWQRQVMSLLTGTFPNCQFVATTHSPQIISETQPDRIILLQLKNGQIIAERCGQAYGLDANYVLEQIMGTPSRPVAVSAAIGAVEDALEAADLELAREKLAQVRDLQHGDDPTSVGLEAAINNLEALADEAD
ncbi:MAG: AAA family ATPase [Beijerinckiaceae bacterium]